MTEADLSPMQRRALAAAERGELVRSNESGIVSLIEQGRFQEVRYTTIRRLEELKLIAWHSEGATVSRARRT